MLSWSAKGYIQILLKGFFKTKQALQNDSLQGK